jgi:hypothetical protein
MDMAAISEKYGWQDVVRQGILSSIDFFLLCQLQSNIGPFFEELCSAISRDATLEEAHRKSAERIRRLMDFHAAPMQAQHF